HLARLSEHRERCFGQGRRVRCAWADAGRRSGDRVVRLRHLRPARRQCATGVRTGGGAMSAMLPLAGRGRRLVATLIDAVLVPLVAIMLMLVTGVLEHASDWSASAM